MRNRARPERGADPDRAGNGSGEGGGEPRPEAASAPTAAGKATSIRLLVMDVDGVLSDGRLIYSPSGEELKSFNVADGMGLNMARWAGLELAIITGRESEMVEIRGRELKIPHIFQGVSDKLSCFNRLLQELGMTAAEAAYIGDDLNDLRVIRAAGLSFSVPGGAREVRAEADYITRRPGGGGAVREAVEFILRRQNRWNELVRIHYSKRHPEG